MIDAPTAMVLIGCALQAAPSVHLMTRRDRSRVAPRLLAVLRFTPVPRTGPDFAPLFAQVAAIQRT